MAVGNSNYVKRVLYKRNKHYMALTPVLETLSKANLEQSVKIGGDFYKQKSRGGLESQFLLSSVIQGFNLAAAAVWVMQLNSPE